MNDFKDKKYDILVATSVVEVGIDIPNATIMIIEAADRFGMAQLHQLRGRVGRGAKQSYCLLYSESQNEETIKRLNLFAKTNNGIKIAEYDFQMRGPGDIYGTRQHGHINLKIAMLSDLKLIESSRKAVDFFLNTYKLEDFPVINSRMKEYQAKQISRD
jgi:ATP-dependent DNA helicase RecG